LRPGQRQRASRRQILRELDCFFATAQRDDCLMVYFSGHGRLNELGHLFIYARDTRTDVLRSTAIRNVNLNTVSSAAFA